MAKGLSLTNIIDFSKQEDPCNGYLSLTRSVPFCEGHELPVRRQFNAITAFVDASNVYASDNDNAHIIRGAIHK